ncbi:MAG: UDP-N-acetylmuramoyl-L-alanyl-D-glutamate--2,6-diaminopimelate ligase [Alphaproteobacteria bacterium]
MIKSNIKMISADSREIKQDGLFLAVRGVNQDGTKFIDSAIENGAIAIITHNDTDTSNIPDNVEVIKSDNPRQTYAKICNEFFQPKPKYFSAVTGTNGKTSIANFTQNIWEQKGYNAIATGTLGFTGCGYEPSSSLTTPEPSVLHQQLSNAKKDKDIDYICMEASSHGLDMNRLDGIEFMSAGFTNLSRDHLDYHNTMDEYFKAKSYLFENLLSTDGVAVLNATIPEYEPLKEICKKRKIKTVSYGLLEKSINGIIPDIHIIGYKRDLSGFDVDMSVMGTELQTRINLPGIFQLENVLCSLGLSAIDCNPVDNVQFLDQVKGVRGRLEYIGMTATGGTVYVDYAHTPDALETVLNTMKPHAKNKLNVIIGCGGDRDKGKRPIMGRVACETADIAYITDDNPRTENPSDIRADMMVGATTGIEIDGRENAIFQAVKDLNAGDILIVAGKGHEQGQIVGDKVLPFDDAKVIRKAIAESV